MHDPDALSTAVSESAGGVALSRRHVEKIAARLLAGWGRRYVALAAAGLLLVLAAVFVPSVAPQAATGGLGLGGSPTAPGGSAGATAGAVGNSSPSGISPNSLSADAFGAGAPTTSGFGGDNGGSSAVAGSDSGVGSVVGPTSGGSGVPTPPGSSIPPCPLPLPSANVPQASLGAILSALGPVLTLGGPLDPSILGAVPLVAPLLPVVGPLAAASAPYEGQINTLANALAPVLAPLENALTPGAQAAGPTLTQLTNALAPLVTAAADTPIMGCVGVVLDSLAAAIPAPSGSSPSSGTGNALPNLAGSAGSSLPPPAGATAPVVVQQVLWSSGLSSSDRAAVSTLAAQKVPVMLNLLDVPPAGSSNSGPAFAQWVTNMVRSLPEVSIWEVGAPSASSASSATIDSVVAALEAAEQNRRVGQFVGIGLAGTESGGQVQLLTSARHALGRSLNFVGVDYEAAGGDTPGAAAAGLRQLLVNVRQSVLPAAGLTSAVPIFATAGYQGAPSAAAAALSAFSAAAKGLGVGLLAWPGGAGVSPPVAALLTSPQTRP